MIRDRLLTFLPLPEHGNARWVYQRLEEHLLDPRPCRHCERRGNTMHIRGKALDHIKSITYAEIEHAEPMDINGIILYLRKGLVQYLALRDGAIITFCALEEDRKAKSA